jgi:hypothetical protein
MMKDYSCLMKSAGTPGNVNDDQERRDRGSRFHSILLSLLPVSGLLLLLATPAGCIRENLDDCPPSSRIVYRYDREGESGGNNVLPVFVSGIIQYIFDENERLIAVDTVRPDKGGRFISWRQLAPGRYTVSGWGNVKGASRVKEAAVGQEMELFLDNEIGTGVQGESERLFYGFREFTVGEQEESNVYVDMTHAHCVLTFAIWWKDAAMTPPETGDYRLVLRDVPSRYGFFPGCRVRDRLAALYSPGMEGYMADGTVINYIPAVHDRERLVTHRTAASMNNKTLRGEIVSYRLSSDSHPVLSIRDGGDLVEREIDLHEFFTRLGIRLDEALRQEYQIGIEIESDRVVTFLMTASVDDWYDGQL